MTLLNDRQIARLCVEQQMITPFVGEKVGIADGKKIYSYGLSSFGYDIRLHGEQFLLLDSEEDRHYGVKMAVDGSFTLPPRGVALGVSVEKFQVPRNVMGVALNKSSYARRHVVCHVTPLESAWTGFLTIEISNLTNHPRKVFANQGIVQVMFYEGEMPDTDYQSAGGTYQDQPQRPVFSRAMH